MPKTLDQVKDNAIKEAKKIILEDGVRGITIRKVAFNIGVAVGTVYNYFPSKDSLIYEAMHDDWECLWEDCRVAIDKKPIMDFEEMISAFDLMFDYVRVFSEKYVVVMNESANTRLKYSSFFDAHNEIISSLNDHVVYIVKRFNGENRYNICTTEIVAEAILRYAAHKDYKFSDIEPIIRKLFV